MDCPMESGFAQEKLLFTPHSLRVHTAFTSPAELWFNHEPKPCR
jgi:hypothetical protein